MLLHVLCFCCVFDSCTLCPIDIGLIVGGTCAHHAQLLQIATVKSVSHPQHATSCSSCTYLKHLMLSKHHSCHDDLSTFLCNSQCSGNKKKEYEYVNGFHMSNCLRQTQSVSWTTGCKACLEMLRSEPWEQLCSITIDTGKVDLLKYSADEHSLAICYEP